MRLLIAIFFIFTSLNGQADCRGCCSHHGGVVCTDGVTKCRDGSDLSSKCQAKGCEKCPVKPKTTKPAAKSDRYDRSLYHHWIDEDGDCQDTRAEILVSHSRTKPKFKDDKQCIVTGGEWVDVYSGQTVRDARSIDIDHVIPLAKAHRLGAAGWDPKKKERFANDPANLLPVSAQLNRQKSAKGPSEWMPPNQKFQCEYVKKWTELTAAYGLKLEENQAAETWIQTKVQSCQPVRLPASTAPKK